MKILSWNVNSIRVRKQQLLDLIKKEKPEIICLQETKVNNDSFPVTEFEKCRYKIFLNGISSYNGVAILTRIEPDKVSIFDFCNKNDGRHIQIEINDVNIHSLYIPAGGDEPDPVLNKKFKHKLNFLDEFLEFSEKEKKSKNIFCGDFNVAPYEDDVWSHKSLRNVVSHTKVERQKLLEILDKGNLIDSTRQLIFPPENLFTWWSYRSPDFKKNNRGRRLDHIWVTNHKGLKLKKAKIISETRELKKPSDHVPVLVEIKV